MTGQGRQVSGSDLPFQVRLVRQALRNRFDGLIDVSDITHPNPGERDRKFSSRALAALIVANRTMCDDAAAAALVVDGYEDYGIDAVGIGDGVPHLWLVQTKWSDKGSAGFGMDEALRMREGLIKLEGRDYSHFNSKLTALAGRVNAVLDQGVNARITLVVGLMGTEPISGQATRRLNEMCADLNSFAEMVDYQIVLAPEIWNIVQAEVSESPVDLEVTMKEWFRLSDPFPSFSGRVPVGEIAEWMAQYGGRLFTKNIRKSLGVTRVNKSLVDTLTSEPHNFWYFNNGITVLCDELTAHPLMRYTQQGPVRLELKRASIVNGAQTATAIEKAAAQNPEMANQAYVTVRVIETGSAPDNLSNDITRANNTQNHVERRDYVVALDPTQVAIGNDFAITLNKVYAIKREAMDLALDAGCTVDQAAIALACAHTNPELAVRAKRSPHLLWEEGDRGVYDLLFKPQPSARQIWRSVLVLRAAKEAVQKSKEKHENRAAAIAEHGDLLVTHIIYQYVVTDDIEDPESDWDAAIKRVGEVAPDALRWLIYHVDNTYGSNSLIGSTLSNPERCRDLAKDVLRDLREGHSVPELPAVYLPPKAPPRTRRANAVSILLDASRIKEGTTLAYQPGSASERAALEKWLATDPRYGQATWVNHRTKPLLWAADEEQYSPSGLVMHMWRLAEWDTAPVAVQGPTRWFVPNEGSLAAIARSVLREWDGDDA